MGKKMETLSKKSQGWMKTVNEILSKASMTPDLRNAVNELRTAIRKKQWDKASELSTVKSFITSTLKTSSRNHFGEDMDYNKTVLHGADVYSQLDGLNHDLAMETGDMPSGTMVITAEGVHSRKPRYFKSPTLALISMERRQIEREAKKLRGIV
jgi:hypothetical protein